MWHYIKSRLTWRRLPGALVVVLGLAVKGLDWTARINLVRDWGSNPEPVLHEIGQVLLWPYFVPLVIATGVVLLFLPWPKEEDKMGKKKPPNKPSKGGAGRTPKQSV